MTLVYRLLRPFPLGGDLGCESHPVDLVIGCVIHLCHLVMMSCLTGDFIAVLTFPPHDDGCQFCGGLCPVHTGVLFHA